VLVAADVAFDTTLDTGEMDARITAIEDEIRRVEPDIGRVYIEPER
jgi:uncharacterized small protein (DUF1192 family)